MTCVTASTENAETTTEAAVTTILNEQTSTTDSDLSTVAAEVTTVTETQTETSN